MQQEKMKGNRKELYSGIKRNHSQMVEETKQEEVKAAQPDPVLLQAKRKELINQMNRINSHQSQVSEPPPQLEEPRFEHRPSSGNTRGVPPKVIENIK
jgi:sRNA-binding carbon storage regulator CsrA